MFIYIKSMSESLSEIRDDIKSSLKQLDQHLIKLILFKDCASRNHWADEVYSFLNSIRRAKNSKKFPKYSFIRRTLAIDEDILDSYIFQIKSDYSDLALNDISDEDVTTLVIAYHDWLATKLSERGIVTRAEVHQILTELNIF